MSFLIRWIMKRGDLYRVYKGAPHAPEKFRVFVIVSSQVLINSNE